MTEKQFLYCYGGLAVATILVLFGFLVWVCLQWFP